MADTDRPANVVAGPASELPYARRWVRQVDLLTLRLFLSAIDKGQIVRAAEAENLVASAATKRIQDLEKLAGVRLLDRSARGVEPSPAGRKLAEHVRAILATLEVAGSDMSAFVASEQAKVVVASLRWVILPYLVEAIGQFARRNPRVAIDLREQVGTPDVLNSLRSGTADVGVFIVYPGMEIDDLDCRTLSQERLVAVLPSRHPLAGRPALRLEQVLDDNFVAFAPPESPMMVALNSAARAAGGELKLRISARSVEVVQELVHEGWGITVVPRCALLPGEPREVAHVPLDDPWALCDVVVATARRGKAKAAVGKFVEHLTAPRRRADR